jgi:hypothetical protein
VAGRSPRTSCRPTPSRWPTIDLDPSAGQKLAVLRLAQRFPSTSDDVSDADAVRDELLQELFADDPDIDYERDVAPWVGDRAAVALVPVAGEDPQPLVVLAHTDRAAAEAGLRRITAEDPGTHLAFSQNADFVLLGPSQQAVDPRRLDRPRARRRRPLHRRPRSARRRRRRHGLGRPRPRLGGAARADAGRHG